MVYMYQILFCVLWFSSPQTGWAIPLRWLAAGQGIQDLRPQPENYKQSRLPTQTPRHTVWCLELGSALWGCEGHCCYWEGANTQSRLLKSHQQGQALREDGSARKEQTGSADLARRVIHPRQEESSWTPRPKVRGGLRVRSRRQGRCVLIPEQSGEFPGHLFSPAHILRAGGGLVGIEAMRGHLGCSDLIGTIGAVLKTIT